MRSTISLLILLLALLLSTAHADCTTFTPHSVITTGNATSSTTQGSPLPGTNTSSPVFTTQISVIPLMSGVTCSTTLAGCTYGPPGSGTTPNYTGQIVYIRGAPVTSYRRMLPRDLNNSDSLWATIQRAIPDTTFWLDIGKSDFASYGSFTILPGQSGYLSFTTYENCVNGTFSGCIGEGFPADGTTSTVCAPRSLPVGVRNCTSPGGVNCLDGVVGWTYTDAQTAAGVTCIGCIPKPPKTNVGPVLRAVPMGLMVLVGFVGWLLF